jgi:cell division protease FtsH
MKFFLLELIYINLVSSFYIKNRYKNNIKLNEKQNYGFYKRNYHEEYLKKLNSRNITLQNKMILDNENNTQDIEIRNETLLPRFRIIIGNNIQQIHNFEQLFNNYNNGNNNNENNNNENNNNDEEDDDYYNKQKKSKSKKSENFEIITNSKVKFKDIGGYDNIKSELLQCVDILKNYTKYSKYAVRVPKGLILEGPPGNGKTLLAKAFAGESNTSFISVSGSQFQEKYVGVGSSRVRELFNLAKKNKPCIIFIDEIDAIGKTRGNDDTTSSERDNTLNELLINLDGFNTEAGIFVIGATNRIDLLDPALIRPGRIDKKIYIGLPDENTRREILKIHLKNKPYDDTINIDDILDLIKGLSGAQIENLLNEAMLYAIRDNREKINLKDLEEIMNRIIAGWQSSDHKYDEDMIMRISIHEIGHTIIGMLSKHHSRVRKVILNFNSPNTPGYTLFEHTDTNLYTREKLFEHLMILLAGRIAEEIFYGLSVTTGASNDFEEALKLADKMIISYGMGKSIVYPRTSDKYKQVLDDEIAELICNAYKNVYFVLNNCKDLIRECAIILRQNKILKYEEIQEIINIRYPEVLNIKI